MKKRPSYILSLCLFSFFVTSNAMASLLLEPYVGVQVSGKTEMGASSAALVEASYDSVPFTIGGRIGYSKLLFSVGLDYQMTKGVELENNTEKFDSDELALFVGVDLPILLRAYAGYIFSASFDGDAGSNYDEGSGGKVGVGFTGFPLISINLEYKVLSYDKRNDVSYFQADHNAVLLAVSLPLRF